MKYLFKVRQARSIPSLAAFFFLFFLAAGCGNDSEEMNDTTPGTEEISAPILKFPDDGGTLSLQDPEVSWFNVATAVSFQIQVSLSEDFDILEGEDDVPATSFMISDFPLKTGRHFWRVRARNEFGTWSSWSEVFSFTLSSG